MLSFHAAAVKSIGTISFYLPRAQSTVTDLLHGYLDFVGKWVRRRDYV